MDKLDKAIIRMMQSDIPLSERPYRELARNHSASEEEIVERIKIMLEKGIIRRLGAVLRHQRAGYRANAMVAWKTDISCADEAGQIMAGFPEISHCYFREVPASFDYPLFSMIHARNEEELEKTIARIARATGIMDYQVLKTQRELKKTSMKYM